MSGLGGLAGAGLVLTGHLLGQADIRRLVEQRGIRPTKKLGQHFLHDPNTIRRIVRTSGISAGDVVLEVGPGLGSLTLGLLAEGTAVTAVEIDTALAQALPDTVRRHAPDAADRLTVVTADALQLTDLPDPQPSALVANLPYNVAVPVILHLLDVVPTLHTGLVMVQSEVADRLTAPAGTRSYGVPSVKVAWYAMAELAGLVPRSVFWPVPNVDSKLVRLVRRPAPSLPAEVSRADVFEVVDLAFASRRKTLRSALAGWAGSPAAAEAILRTANVDPSARGETLEISDYARIASAAQDPRPQAP